MAAPAKERAAKRLSFQDRVLLMLKNPPNGVVATTADLCTIHHRFATSIHGLRKLGWSITTTEKAMGDDATYKLDATVVPMPQPDLLRRVPPAQPSAPPVSGLCECGHVAGMHRRTIEKSGLYCCTGCDCIDFKQQ